MSSLAGEAKAHEGLAFGRYILQQPIGRGGMAEVWRAKLVGAHDFSRQVVIKRILPHLSASPEFSRMFTVEAKLCARLNHPNIVQVYELSSVEDELFLAMEYVPGLNLVEMGRRLGPGVTIPVGMAAQIVRDVCRALAYAHSVAGEDKTPLCIVHRDISPSNVMLTFDGTVKLLDFGIAKVMSSADEDTKSGVLKGKLGYLSPEAAQGLIEPDARADIFGAGVVLHELITGRRLFKGRDDLHTLALVRACEVPLPSSLRPEVTPELDRICLEALARDREQRIATADELARGLTDVVRRLGWDELATAAFLREHDIRPAETPLAPSPPTETCDAALAGPTVSPIAPPTVSPIAPLPLPPPPRSQRVLTATLAGSFVLVAALLGARLWRSGPPPVAPLPPLPSSSLPSPSSPPPLPPTPPSPAPAPATAAAVTPPIAPPPTPNKLHAHAKRHHAGKAKPATPALDLNQGAIDHDF